MLTPCPPALQPKGETEAPSSHQCPQCPQERSASPLLQRQANRAWLQPETVSSMQLGTNVPMTTGHSLALEQSTQYTPISGTTPADHTPQHTVPGHPWAAVCRLHTGGGVAPHFPADW